MAENDVFHAGFLEHRRAQLAGKRAGLFPVHVLRAELDVRALDDLAHRGKVNGRGAKRNTRLESGDILQLYINDEFFDKPSEENSRASLGVLFIFQLPAIIGLRITIFLLIINAPDDPKGRPGRCNVLLRRTSAAAPAPYSYGKTALAVRMT